MPAYAPCPLLNVSEPVVNAGTVNDRNVGFLCSRGRARLRVVNIGADCLAMGAPLQDFQAKRFGT